jgi:hypothetical protein
VVESPYAGDVEANVRYARLCVCDSLARGEAPYASHLFFTQPHVLDDTVPEERARGIEAGLAWAAHADLVAVYLDRGLSRGMELGILRHLSRGLPIVLRSVGLARVSDEILKKDAGLGLLKVCTPAERAWVPRPRSAKSQRCSCEWRDSTAMCSTHREELQRFPLAKP